MFCSRVFLVLVAACGLVIFGSTSDTRAETGASLWSKSRAANVQAILALPTALAIHFSLKYWDDNRIETVDSELQTISEAVETADAELNEIETQIIEGTGAPP